MFFLFFIYFDLYDLSFWNEMKIERKGLLYYFLSKNYILCRFSKWDDRNINFWGDPECLKRDILLVSLSWDNLSICGFKMFSMDNNTVWRGTIVYDVVRSHTLYSDENKKWVQSFVDFLYSCYFVAQLMQLLYTKRNTYYKKFTLLRHRLLYLFGIKIYI